MLNNKYYLLTLLAFLSLSILASSGICEEVGSKDMDRIDKIQYSRSD